MSARSISRRRKRELERGVRRDSRVGSKGSKAVIAGGAALGAAADFAPAAHGATFTVTNTNDVFPPDNSCDAADCTLRDALEASNDAADADVITFASGLSGAITLDDSPLYTGSEVAIQGPGAGTLTVSGGDDTQILAAIPGYLGPGGPATPVSISGLTLADGRAGGPDSYYFAPVGGAVLGIDANLSIANSVITGGYAPQGGGVTAASSYDPGDPLDGSLTITGSAITDNVAELGGGVVGQALSNAVISDSAITGNRAVYHDDNTGIAAGGALIGSYDESLDADILIEDTTVANNFAEAYLGGIAVATGDEMAIRNTTISGNTGAEGVGGVLAGGGENAPVVIQGTTISNNVSGAGEYQGGAMILSDPYGSGMNILNSTIANNSAVGVGGGVYLYSYGGGGYGDPDDPGTIAISSSIVSGNTPDDLAQEGEGDPALFSLGFSLVGNTGNSGATEFPAGSNHFGIDPQLGPLAANGGPTQTHLPALSSPVLDQGIANFAPTDQRGLARTGDLSAIDNAAGGDGTDIGSVEIQAGACRGKSVPKIDGTDADDNLTGTPGADAIFGLAGKDRLRGVAGADCLNGDAGKDTLKGGGGKDAIKGGAGKDKLRGQGGKDKLKGQGGKDNLNGGEGKDKLTGGAGKDKLRGGPAKDKVKGGGGKDRINAVDEKRDKVNCGGGDKDKVVVDAEDRVSGNCEKVVVKGG
ncbi:MAG: choice-of-anchor Q domain-containing protein [Solirubrobacterales bacterium]